MNTILPEFKDELRDMPDYSWREAQKNDSPFEYKLVTKYYANGTVKFVMTKIKRFLLKTDEHRDITDYRHLGKVLYIPNKILTDEELELKRQDNIRRSAQRAKQSVEDAVRALGADHMVTLSTRENITDRTKFFQIFTRFIRLVRNKDYVLSFQQQTPVLRTRSQKRNWGYVAVPELQKRGAYHMHIACVGKQDLNLLRACWYVALGGQITDKGENVKGQVDVQFRQKRFGGQSLTYKNTHLVNYLTKYITKSFTDDEELGTNRYKRAHFVPKPIVHKQFIWSSYSNDKGDFVSAIAEVYAIASFQGITELQPWNPKGDGWDEQFILLGKETA